MKVIRAVQAETAPAQGALYIGGKIDFALLAGAPETGEVEIYRVDFAPGARNRVHVHTRDQILIATAGRGIVADSSGEQVMEPGDAVTIPAGHPHWHGAAADQAFSHLTIAAPGDEIEIVDGDERGAWGASPESGA